MWSRCLYIQVTSVRLNTSFLICQLVIVIPVPIAREGCYVSYGRQWRRKFFVNVKVPYKWRSYCWCFCSGTIWTFLWQKPEPLLLTCSLFLCLCLRLQGVGLLLSTSTRHVHSSFFLARAPNCKQPKCSSTDKWINKSWNINIMEYHSAIKMN